MYVCIALKSGLTLFRAGFFGLPGTGGRGWLGLRRPYTGNSITAYGMATKFTRNDVLICSIPFLQFLCHHDVICRQYDVIQLNVLAEVIFHHYFTKIVYINKIC